MRGYTVVIALTIAACSGGDAEQRVELDQKPEFASAPIESPEIDGAAWSGSEGSNTLTFGKLGSAPLFSLECREGATVLTRNAPADPQAAALMPLIGNGKIVRLPVDAVVSGESHVWQGSFPADDERLDVLIGSRGVEATVPGAGSIDLAASPLPGDLITSCRLGANQQNPQQLRQRSQPDPAGQPPNQ